MEYQLREGGTAGYITTGLRERFEVVDGRFEVPDGLDAGAHQRLIDAGHVPVEPGELPPGVEYDGDGAASRAESGSSSDSDDGPTDGPSDSGEDEETASGEERTGAMTSDVLREDSEEVPEPPKPLDEMNRSELYQFGNEELGLELEWSGEEALDEAEMRSAISEEVPDGS